MDDNTGQRSGQQQSSGSDQTQDERDAGIRLGSDTVAEEVERGEEAWNTYGSGTGGLGETTGGGEARGDFSGTVGTGTGRITGGTGAAGSDVWSTDAGKTDPTGGGTAAGLGSTGGGDTA